MLVALFPPIFCIIFTKNVKLTKAQNAHDGRDLAGRQTDEDVHDDLENRVGRGRVRLRSESGVSGISIFDNSVVNAVNQSPRTLARILEAAEARRTGAEGNGNS